jgi:hypothetical protein
MVLKFTVDTSGMDAVKEAAARACTKAEHEVAVQVETDTRPFVPSSGAAAGLINRTRVIGNSIVYPGPYARYLYNGKLMVDPETGSSWVRKGEHKVTTDRNLVFRTDVNPQAQSHWFEASKAQNLDKWVRVADKAVKKFGTG